MGMLVYTQVDSRMVPIPHSKNRPTLVVTNINFKSIQHKFVGVETEESEPQHTHHVPCEP
jgi:hypothetical protein